MLEEEILHSDFAIFQTLFICSAYPVSHGNGIFILCIVIYKRDL